jgi:Na+-translocating ferredoxin:NAD+ oxidoreductase RnfD subunit
MKLPIRPRDPRYYQIAVLGMLVSYGVVVLEFGIHWYNALAVLVTAMIAQFAGTRLAALPSFDPRSPLITALSLTLLLRTDDVVLAMLAAAIAIGSKFLIRVRGKHVFNPANVALVVLMLISDRAWVSSGQWGSTAIIAFALACLGLIVLTHAKRSETTIGFLVMYAGLLFGRALWLEDPLSIPLHQVQNGALLLFAFFMISDPKTTPDTAIGRYVFSGIVALIAFIIQFVFYEPNGPILALVMSAPLVPLIDTFSRGRHYQWHRPQLATRHSQPQ